MKNSIWIFLLFLNPFASDCQSSLSGVINSYAKVIDLNHCEGILAVSDTTGFQIGENVLLVQAKGAEIDGTNSSSYGDIIDLAGAGFYEKNQILSKEGNEIHLKYLVSKEFEASGNIQLVTFPQFTSAIVLDTLTALPWNGELGGILAFEVEGLLEMNGSIDVSEKGFNGASTVPHISDCSFLTNANNYHYGIDNWRGAPKGEGIVAVIPGKEQGRGAQANGGGGGNDHNAGGGGGANITAGGVGGKQSVSGFGCDGDFAGVGGKSLPGIADRIYFGGGGGAGHDNNGVATNGGNGGGIVIIVADVIEGNGQTIFANGQSALTSNGDGAGGGGGGGTIFIDTEMLVGELIVESKGGIGGDTNNPTERCLGVGGGGSGGRLITNNSEILVELSAGSAGVNLNPSSQCNGQSNGGQPGEEGLQTVSVGINGSSIEIMESNILIQPISIDTCVNESFSFTTIVGGNGLNYQWEFNNGNGWQLLDNDIMFYGVQTSELFVAGLDLSWDEALFRCYISNDCGFEEYTEQVSLDLLPIPVSSFNFMDLGNGFVQFENNSSDASSYHWEFGDSFSSTEIDPIHEYLMDGAYEVTLSAFNECGEISYTETIVVGGVPIADFSFTSSDLCTPVEVQFNNLSAGLDSLIFFWEFEGGTPASSTDLNPIILYTQEGQFDVRLIAQNLFGTDTLIQEDIVIVFETPSPDFDYSLNGPQVSFINNSNGGTFWIWDFGDTNTSTEENPIHTYGGVGTFEVSLTAGNQSCGATISQEITILSPNSTTTKEDISISVFPNPVSDFLHIQIKNESSEPSQLTVFDLHGRGILKTEIGKETKIDMQNYSSGIYQVIIENGERRHHLRVAKI